ncbi:hypothetical protein K438DRAFT_2096818 [Mycena galopus ATCC 62051]|nr:hypothetical protein K438DRAFT_2096818 [Mycena galopus ATCC 62051]
MNIDEDTLTQHQKTSTELIVYSHLAEKVVTVSWPLHNGYKIKPQGIKNYLRAHGLFLECFCSFQSDCHHPRSCQIVVSSITGDVFGFCHYDSARCTSKINFSNIHKKCLLKASYVHLPTLQSGEVPDTKTLLVAFNLRRFHRHEIAPHFEGYLGEHSSGYPNGTRQLGGCLLTHRPSNDTARLMLLIPAVIAKIHLQTLTITR